MYRINLNQQIMNQQLNNRILFLYSSTDGQTVTIVQKMIDHLSDQVQVDLLDSAENKAVNLQQYHMIVIAASIRYGKFNTRLNHFINRHASELNTMKSAFFGVNLIARKLEKRTAQTNVYVRKFLARSPWKPTVCEVFAGALLYSRYTWYDKAMIQLIMKITGGVTDTSKDVIYTDWQQVEDCTRKLLVLLKENNQTI